VELEMSAPEPANRPRCRQTAVRTWHGQVLTSRRDNVVHRPRHGRLRFEEDDAH
jgi:hypothetical protein